MLSLVSRIGLVIIVAIDLYIVANVLVYYFELKSLKGNFKPINELLADYPLYFYIFFGAIIGLAAITAEPRRIPMTLIFGAVGIILFNMFGKAFSNSLFSFF